jgi:hypothetical protein
VFGRNILRYRLLTAPGVNRDDAAGNIQRLQQGRHCGDFIRLLCGLLLDRLERDEGDVETLKERILPAGAAFMREIDLLTSMKGISAFIAIAIWTLPRSVDTIKQPALS